MDFKDIDNMFTKDLSYIENAIKKTNDKIEGDLKQFIIDLILSGDVYTAYCSETNPVTMNKYSNNEYTVNYTTKYLHCYEPFRHKQSLENKLNEIREFCVDNKECMWAAKIWSIITNRDFRDIASERNKND